VGEGKVTSCVGKLHSSSLMAFHGPKASRSYQSSAGSAFDASNSYTGEEKKGEERRGVDYGDHVTIYGNIGDDGLYLSPAVPQLHWKKTKKHIMKEPIGESEWSLSRVDGTVIGELTYGDIICVESVSKPGHFVTCAGDTVPGMEGNLLLSTTSKDYFVILCPTLRELVKLEAERKNVGKGAAPKRNRVDEDSDIVIRERAQANRALRGLLQTPIEIVYEIFRFTRGWKSTFRLVCKEWRDIAEREVYSIRLNNGFSAEGSKLFRFRITNFVQRCVNLNKIFLRNMDDISDREAIQLFVGKPLKKISIGGCRMLTDETIRTICKVKILQHLNIACSKVTDTGLRLMAEELTGLISLDLYGCQNITANGIREILTLPNLQALNLRGTPINDAALTSLQSRLKGRKLQILTGPLLTDDVY
jgi:hypothetical protein